MMTNEAEQPNDSAAVSSRLVRVRAAVEGWCQDLTDLGGRNGLLHYRDLQVGTLDLTPADPHALERLLRGAPVRISRLFANLEGQQQPAKSARTIYRKAKDNLDERGVDTLYVACGLASWENKRGAWQPAAPIVLRQAVLKPIGAAQEEFELQLVGDHEINPTLLHVLKVDFDCTCDEELLRAKVDGAIDEAWELRAAYDWLNAATAPHVPSFAIHERIVLANFAYAKLPMVRDLESSIDDLAEHDVIAAIAGDAEASAAIAQPGGEPVPSPDHIPLADEFLILDADLSQNYAINAAIAGQNIVVNGPPGTGKSQSIANLIAALIARGQRVLFVAEKRAAVNAVLKRLEQQGIGDLVMNVHGGVPKRRAFAQNIGAALTSSASAPPVDFSAEQRQIEAARAELVEYEASLHAIRPPWNISIYKLRANLDGLTTISTALRIRGEVLNRLDGSSSLQRAEDIGAYARLGGFVIRTDSHPWAETAITTPAAFQECYSEAESLAVTTSTQLPRLLDTAAVEVGAPKPETLSELRALAACWSAVRDLQSYTAAGIYSLDLDATLMVLKPASRGRLRALFARLTSPAFRRARREVLGMCSDATASDDALYQTCVDARKHFRAWRELNGIGPPRVPTNIDAIRDAIEASDAALAVLIRYGAMAVGQGDRLDDIRHQAQRLVDDRATAAKLPELHRLRSALVGQGLEPLLADLRESKADEEQARAAFWQVWHQSVLDHLSLTEPLVAGFIPEKQEHAVAEFQRGDRRHIARTAARILRICAERSVAARDQFPAQAQTVYRQANLKKGHLAVRDFLRAAPDVLLALKPCWMMSPLSVSQLLPLEQYFDLVIFDEASQVTPADAIPAIARGKRVVVAGDQKQLPPTRFFVGAQPEAPSAPSVTVDGLPPGTQGFESILDVLCTMLRPARTLQWHYRSRDERLIAFSNTHIYDRMLTTFPGIEGAACLRYVMVPWEPGSDTNSPSPEVLRVVDLVIEHARTRPTESLGVIAMGVEHADRIDDALRRRLRDDAGLAAEVEDFFREDRDEAFFAKNLERVQGDERDAIILSVGYGKNTRGELVYRFGPLLQDGGERRLNVAITRAKTRMTLVASFSALDMDPDKCKAAGMMLLRQYMQYVESGGLTLGDRVADKPKLNPFEIDVRDTLTARGISVTPQYGVSGFWIDFAVHDPRQPGRYLLAIECDGAMYHSSESARDRDRLRQEQLERLGWRFHRIWSTEWFYNKAAALEKVLAAYQSALASDPTTGDIGGASPAGEPVQLEPLGPVRQAPRPRLWPGREIAEYSSTRLVELARWIESDQRLRTEEELLDEMMVELGFHRHGKNIVATLRAAIARARRA